MYKTHYEVSESLSKITIYLDSFFNKKDIKIISCEIFQEKYENKSTHSYHAIIVYEEKSKNNLK